MLGSFSSFAYHPDEISSIENFKRFVVAEEYICIILANDDLYCSKFDKDSVSSYDSIEGLNLTDEQKESMQALIGDTASLEEQPLDALEDIELDMFQKSLLGIMKYTGIYLNSFEGL